MRIERIVPHLRVPDLWQALHEHGEVLGMRPIMDHGWIATLGDDDGHQLSVITADETAPVTADVSVFVDDIHEAHLRVLRSGLEIVHPLTEEAWGVTRFFFRDSAERVINVGMHSEPAGWDSLRAELEAELEATLQSAAADSFVTLGAAIRLSEAWLFFPDCVVDTEGWIEDPTPLPVPLHVDVPAVVRDVLTHLKEEPSPRDQLWLALESWLEMLHIRAGNELSMAQVHRRTPPTPWFSCLLHAPSVSPELRFRRGGG
ncbi:hypothetical protein [Corynebacterium nasicanis]|uniref:VOC domain-containing protein n=1 Tax=Corynebacterium nasicanis TaxID=1448267 RepID=A0ABW1QCC0_9CORY